MQYVYWTQEINNINHNEIERKYNKKWFKFTGLFIRIRGKRGNIVEEIIL